MKTSVLAILAGLSLGVGMVSCAQDEEIKSNQGRAIDFRPAMATRASETTNANIQDINVTAMMGDADYFTGETFTKNGTYFTSANDYYWPGDDTPLTFYAFSPSDLSGVTIDKSAKTLDNFSPATSMADQVDFITAVATGKKSENENAGVPLTFDHRLSQIEVLAKTNNSVYTFKVSGVRIGEPVDNGSFNFDSDQWTLGTSKTIYESDIDEVTLSENPVSLMGEGGNAMLLPQQLVAWAPATDASNSAKGAYLSVKLQIATAETGVQIYPFPTDGECEWAAIPISTNWEPGKKYIYTLDFSHGAGYVDPHDPDPGVEILGGPIKFTVTVADWNQTSEDLDMKTYTE